MIRLRDAALSARVAKLLDRYQADVDAATTYAERVERAKAAFARRNKDSDPAFKEIRRALAALCSGNRRCCYCEDSFADEVEHIQPKDLYPDLVFSWLNYLYACGPCNGPKNNRFAVILPTGEQREVTRRRGDPVVPPIAGQPALINPRAEDPLRFLDLDILDTFLFLPAEGLFPNDVLRAEYTIDVLALNRREVLVQARRTAYGSYRARLHEYRRKAKRGDPPIELDALATGLRTMDQPTVWAEMKRRHRVVPELAELFRAVPGALDW